MSETYEPEKMVATPKRRFEYNLNTLVILLGFAGGLVAWGATWERVNANWNSQANSIEGGRSGDVDEGRREYAQQPLS